MPGTPLPPSPRPSGIPIGLSDFRDLRRTGMHYVDKTSFVAGVLAASDAVLLFPRPRRFGKTVNLSTLRCFSAIRREIAEAYRQHRYLLEGDALDEQQQRDFVRILGKEGDETLYWSALRELSAHLHRHHGERVVILIDEYDSPIPHRLQRRVLRRHRRVLPQLPLGGG